MEKDESHINYLNIVQTVLGMMGEHSSTFDCNRNHDHVQHGDPWFEVAKGCIHILEDGAISRFGF